MEAQPNGYVSGELKNQLMEMIKVVVLPEMSESHEQCIYKVPQKIRQANPQAYTPQIISIGPFHNPHCSIWDNNILSSKKGNNNNLLQMEELKVKYLKGFLNRTKLSMDDLVSELQKWENKIRNCYAGLLSFDSNDFLRIIIVDACFIIELFLRCPSDIGWKEYDPILAKPGLLNDIFSDLVLLENQLPFFVLEEVYKLAYINLPEAPSFVTITIRFFSLFKRANINSERLCPKHFTDLIRSLMLPSSFDCVQEQLINTIEHVYSVSQLSEAGLDFKVSESKCLLGWRFDKGVLQMPCFHVHDATETYMRNIIAFEQCHMLRPDICQYFTILDFLINTEKDVSILTDKKIIVNLIGDANEVATMVNNLCKNVARPKFNSKYVSLCRRLNGFYENPRNKYKAIFVHEYFNTPWKIARTITAVLLLLFTLIQAVCSIWTLVK